MAPYLLKNLNLFLFPKIPPGPYGIVGEFHQSFKEEIVSILHKFIQKSEGKGTLTSQLTFWNRQYPDTKVGQRSLQEN